MRKSTRSGAIAPAVEHLGRFGLGRAADSPARSGRRTARHRRGGGSTCRRFTIGQRLTPHVRHRQKYVDVPVAGQPCVRVSKEAGAQAMLRARTLREFVTGARRPRCERQPTGICVGAISHGGSRTCFGDHALARELRGYEQEHVRTVSSETIASDCCRGQVAVRAYGGAVALVR